MRAWVYFVLVHTRSAALCHSYKRMSVPICMCVFMIDISSHLGDIYIYIVVSSIHM